MNIRPEPGELVPEKPSLSHLRSVSQGPFWLVGTFVPAPGRAPSVLAEECPMTPSQFAWNAVRARDTLPHGQRPTDLHIRIAWLLARWQDPCPSHAKLARAARCHRNSVANALRRFRALGLLTWQRQVVRLRGGWVARTSNRYLFAAPGEQTESIFTRPPKFVRRAPEAERQAAKQARAKLMEAATKLPDLLKARREAMTLRWICA